MVKVTHERWKCIGCGACANICAEYWEMSDDGKSTLKGAEYKDTGDGKLGELTIDDAKCNKEAEAGCPVNCIHVKEAAEEKKEE
jgi:ferredoxin